MASLADQAAKRTARVVEETRETTPGFNWVRLNKIKWVDERGRDRQWESAERTTRKTEIDGIAVIAHLQGGKYEQPHIVLVSQFRPPCGGYCLELPAGLVDSGETGAQAALRELKEECGYKGTFVKESPIVYADPGMINACMRYVYVNVDMNDPENQNPVTEQEDAECITTHIVPVDELLKTLEAPKEFLGVDNAIVDARLYGIALGMSLMPKI